MAASRDHPRHRAGRVAAVRVRDGRDAVRAGGLCGRAQRRALGPQGQHLRIRDGRPQVGLAGSVRCGHQDDAVPQQHLPAARGDLAQARCRAHRGHGDGAAESRSRRQSRGGRRDPGRQGVGSAPGLHPRLGRPHLSHEDGRGSLQAAHRLGVETDRGDGPARELSDRDRRAGRADHARRHAPELSDGDRVRRGLAERPRRQGHRQPRGQAGHPSRAHGGSRHRPHVGRPDRAADPPPRAHDRRSRRGPRFRAGEAAAR